MKLMATINMRIPIDVADWLEAEADQVGITATSAARLLMIKAKDAGITLRQAS